MPVPGVCHGAGAGTRSSTRVQPGDFPQQRFAGLVQAGDNRICTILGDLPDG